MYVLVTSSTRGIGKSIGIKLLEKGYYVFFNYANNDKSAKELYKELNEKYKFKFSIIKADLSSDLGINIIYDAVTSITTYLNCIILNTGVTCYDDFNDITLDIWNNVININLTIPFFLVQKFSNMIKDDGRLIFINTLLGLIPHGRSIPYSVSKSASMMLSKNLVKIFKSKNITVNSIAVGFVDTEWHKNKEKEHIERIENKIALHRFGNPQEVADLCFHIIENQYINGAIINLDGGYDME